MGQWTRQHTFDPRAVGVTIRAWYRMDRGITLNSTTISAIADQSAQGDSNRNLAQATAANQPSYTSADSAFKGMPSAVFDGTPKYMLSGTWSASNTQPCFWLFVGLSGNVSAAQRFAFDAQTATEHALFSPTSSKNASVFAGTTLNSGASIAAASVVGITFNGGSSAVYVNALTATASGNAGAAALPALTYGAGFNLTAGNSWVGTNTELLLVGSVPSATVKERLMRYAAMRYGTTLAL